MYHMVHRRNVPDGTSHRKPRAPAARPDRGLLIDQCLRAFVDAGSLEMSLDGLADAVGTSKRMLIHYFGSREQLEMQAIARLEDQLRGQFSTGAFPAGASARDVVLALWDEATAPRSRGLLLLTMELARRAWSGSASARAFYREQWRLWSELLRDRLKDAVATEQVLQCFQGAVMRYLITGEPEPGRRALMRLVPMSPSPRVSRRRHGRL
jgi:AcrR family transcriptional regulator